MSGRAELEQRLALIAGILDGAFFTPLHVCDWPAYCLGTAALLRLTQGEMLDVFVRAAIAAETVDPESAEGRTPLAWLWGTSDPAPVLAHALVSLRADRPFLFHRVLWSLPAARAGKVRPESFELMEDFFAEALRMEPEDLDQAAAQEIETLAGRGMAAAGLEAGPAAREVADQAARVLALPEAREAQTDADLRLWLAAGGGLDSVDPALAPAVLVEAWRRWCGAVTGAEPDLGLLAAYLPELDIEPAELALMAPVDPAAGHVITAECPYCGQRAEVRLGPEVEAVRRCEHLLYVGTDDPAHLWEVDSRFEVGEATGALMASYYQSPPDLDLFATVAGDMFEMLAGMGRLQVAPVNSETAPRAFYQLIAFFGGEPQEGQASRH